MPASIRYVIIAAIATAAARCPLCKKQRCTICPNHLANKVIYGDQTAQDKAEAAYWFTKAANQGNADAQYNLGVMYYNSYGVAQDKTKAVQWYTKAAEQGHAKAQYDLGLMYYIGDGVAQDEKKAIEWLTKVAEQGNKDAQKALREIIK